jgi:hypothetical protein
MSRILASDYRQTARRETFQRFLDVINSGHTELAELNIAMIRLLMSEFSITTSLVRSSDLGVPPMPKELRPLEIVRALGGTEYLTGPTALPYTPLQIYREANVRVLVKTYDYARYDQLWPGYDGHVSALDLLLSTSPDESQRLLRSSSPDVPLTD